MDAHVTSRHRSFGHLGRHVVELLLANQAEPIIATTRRPQALKDLAKAGVCVRRASFDDDDDALMDEFRGASRALLVSTNERPGRRALQHKRAVLAIERAGVKHIVYTSMLDPVGSPVVTEEHIAASTMDATILRDSIYAETLMTTLTQAVAIGQIVDARNDAAVSYVTRDDCARVAAVVLASGRTRSRILDVTGPEAVTSNELAALASEITARHTAYVSVDIETLVRRLMERDASFSLAVLQASYDVAASRGDFATVSDSVSSVGHRVPTTVRQFLAMHRAALLREPSRFAVQASNFG